MISRFHYLTQDLPDISHQELTEIACKNGIRWIQLRIKNKSEEDCLQIAKEVKLICNHFNTTLIINDHTEIAKAVGADGVHLGKNDMSVSEARIILGNSKIIGGTANNLADILSLQNMGVDYIGLGPFRFTDTKKNLSEILGIDGIKNILDNKEVTVPVIAIGGIQPEDVKSLINTGVYGVAVSSAINLSSEKKKVIALFQSMINS